MLNVTNMFLSLKYLHCVDVRCIQKIPFCFLSSFSFRRANVLSLGVYPPAALLSSFCLAPSQWKPLPFSSACLEIVFTPQDSTDRLLPPHNLEFSFILCIHSYLLLVRLCCGSITLCGVALAWVRGQSARLAQAPAKPAPRAPCWMLWAERPLGGTDRSGNRLSGKQRALKQLPHQPLREGGPQSHQREHVNPDGNGALGRCKCDGRIVDSFKDTQLEGGTAAPREKVFCQLRAWRGRRGLATLPCLGKEAAA